MKAVLLTLFALVIPLLNGGLVAQTTDENSDDTYSLSLQEAIDFALENSYETTNARRDIAAAIKRKWETTADGLPQINASVDYQNRLKLPVQLLPAEIAGGDPGSFIPITFGTKQQMSATARAEQIIFDGSYIVAVRAAKTFLDYTDTQAEKTALDVRKNVIDAYGNVLLAEQSVDILKHNKQTLEENLNDTKELYQNGFREEEDFEQLKITLSQVTNQLSNTKRLREITREVLKLALGIQITNKVVLTQSLDHLAQQNVSLELMNEEDDIQDNVNIKLAETQIRQREHELKLEKSKALPKLTTFVNYGTTAYSETFSFFNHDQNWFQMSTFGVSLTVPIFSSFKREAKTAQKRIALKQAETEFDKTQQQIKLKLTRAKNSYQNAIDNYQTQKQNLDLAERIESKNQTKFNEGVASSFELKQAQNQLYTAQQDYLQSMVDLLNAKAELENILNTPDLDIEAGEN